MKLINGHCLEALQNFEDQSIDYVFTSPPYNIKRSKNSKYNKYEHFDDGIENYLEWSIKIIDELLRVTKNHVFWNIQANYYNKKDIYRLIGHYADVLIQNFIWTKSHYVPASEHYAISNAVEYVLAFSNEKRIKGNEINNLNEDNKTAHTEVKKDLRFIKQNLFDPNEGIWAEVKQNSNFRKDTIKWRSALGLGVFSLIGKQMYDFFKSLS